MHSAIKHISQQELAEVDALPLIIAEPKTFGGRLEATTNAPAKTPKVGAITRMVCS